MTAGFEALAPDIERLYWDCNGSGWALAGLEYGYPHCCIVSFCNMLHIEEDAWQNPLEGTGFVPCRTCSETKTAEQLTCEINAARLVATPF